jgi:hypothetical protein
MRYFLFTEDINQKINTAFAVVLMGTLLVIQVATIRCIRLNNKKIITEHTAQVVYEREKRATITISFVLGALVVFLLPAVIVQTAIGFSDENEGIIAANFAMTAILVNSSANPLIYFWRNKEIRKNCLRIFDCTNKAHVHNMDDRQENNQRKCSSTNALGSNT